MRLGFTPQNTTPRRGKLATGVLSTQLLISAALLTLIVAVFVFSPDSLTSPALFWGLTMVFVVTIVAALFPWDRVPREAIAILPMLDIVAIIAVRYSAPGLGAGILLMLPVIWLARHSPKSYVIGGVALSTLLLWGSRAVADTPTSSYDFGTVVLLPLVLGFVASAVFMSARRGRAQQVLLRRNAEVAEIATERAERQEQILNRVLDAVDFGVLAFDENGDITHMNRAQREALVTFGAPEGAAAPEVIYQADRITPFEEHDRPLARAKLGESLDNVVVWAGEPGSYRAAYSVSSRPLRGSCGEFQGGVLVLYDVTETLDAVRARNDLVASITHELRTPLTSILGYLDLARDSDALDRQTVRMLDIAYLNADRMLLLVTDLLSAGKAAQQALPIDFANCELSGLVDHAIDSHRLSAQAKSVSIHRIGSDRGRVTADPLRIAQVLDNLLSNAIKYNRDGGRVDIELREDVDSVTVAVSDTGLGISDSDITKVFDTFFRTDAARRSEVGGSGLGLSIARDIAERHGGGLTVRSAQGSGATFTLSLPRSPRPDTDTRQSRVISTSAARTYAA